MKKYTTTETLLYVDKLSVGYKDKNDKIKLILKDVTIVEKDIVREGHDATGQCIAIIGRSGRGKSTLFKALTGLMQPTSGQILISNLSTEDKSDAKSVSEGDIGFVDQKYTLFRHKTIYQICKYALRKSKLTKIDIHNTIIEGLTEWELLEHKDKYSSELSGGQKQRVSILEQILTSKHLMILDEPTSGLDVGAINTVKRSFNKILNSNEYNTLIFSTHNIEFAVEMADSIYIVGFPDDSKEYSTIVKHYDLKEMDMSWTEYGIKHVELVKEIKELLMKH